MIIIKKLFKLAGIIIVAIFALTILLMIFAGDSEPKPATQPAAAVTKQEPPREPEKPDLEITEKVQLTREHYGTMKVTGKVRNNTEDTMGYVEIDFNCFDEQGNQVGTAMTNVQNLGAGATWKFEAIILQDNVVRVELSELKGF